MAIIHFFNVNLPSSTSFKSLRKTSGSEGWHNFFLYLWTHNKMQFLPFFAPIPIFVTMPPQKWPNLTNGWMNVGLGWVGLRCIWLNGITTSPYPEVTLDNFGFLVGAHLALRQSILWLAGSQKWPFRGSKMQFLGQNLFFWRHRPIFFYFNDRTPKMFYVESGEWQLTVDFCHFWALHIYALEPSITLFWFQVTTVLVACQKFYFHPTALLGLCLSVIVPYFQFGTLGWIKYWPIRNMNSRLRSDWSVILMISSVPLASAVLIWKLCGLCLYSSEICGGPNVILPQDLQHKF